MENVNKTPPNGMILVSKEQFYSALEADKRDIIPSVKEPYITTWETKNRELFGWESTGWKNPGEEPLRYIYPGYLPKVRGE